MESLKLKPNEWLTNRQFLDYANVENRYYFETLCEYVSEYLKNTPIPVICTFDPKNQRLYFLIGKDNKNWWDINPDISYIDTLTLIKRWVKQFYPKYKLEYLAKVSLTDDEIYKKVSRENMRLDDAILLKKEILIEEKGIVGEITLSKDEFIFYYNDRKTLRISGSPDNLLPLRFFLKEIRNIEDDKEKRDYIFKNSYEVKEFNSMDEEEILINYIDKQMKNFFIINFPDLKYKNLFKISDNRYRWDNYVIEFNNKLVEQDCFKYVLDRRNELSINIDEIGQK